jgi:membrane protein
MATAAAAVARAVRRWVEMAWEVVASARQDRASGLAAEVAFYWVLGLFPALLMVAAVLGSLQSVVGQAVADEAEEQVLSFLQRVLTDDASGTIDAVRNLFESASPGVATIGALAALWAASRGFAAMIQALGLMYDVAERRSYLRLRAMGLLLAAGSIVVVAVVLAMVVLGPLLGRGQDVAQALGLGSGFATLWDWVRWPAVVVVVVAWATTVYHLAPDQRTPWRWDVPGALLAATLWAIVSLGLRLYLRLTAGSNQVFGVLGGPLIVMLWLYLLAIALLVGGELNAVLAARRRAQSEGAPGEADPGAAGANAG